MRAGRLNRRCTILKPVRAINEVGESVLSWSPEKTVWASSWQSGAREQRTAAGVGERVQHEIRIRRKAYPGLESDHRLRLGKRDFEIVGIIETEDDIWRVLATEYAS